ncbi:MBOAT family O-acyltransferase [Sulfurovum lithotrophicum]|uniref:MBOAT family O-acyltransferase n=1 Tax=Sulfurovum lithotrophicum TaxID=206403 RepID=UPI001CB6BE4A|nr:MBOAT family O-acyltransferase [Sulfurovum lithotrophicum]
MIISSFVFYTYGQPILSLLLLSSASINAVASYFVYFENNKRRKKQYAFLGVAFNLAVLSFFKYSPLFGRALEHFRSLDGIGDFLVSIPLPVGISFYTFQGISLVVDLYRSNHQSECPLFKVDRNFIRHYIHTIFFISFFPQLVAGPIVKAYEFYPQIKTKYLEEINFESAFKILIIGYFLKMVIADNLKDQTFWMMFPYFQVHSSYTLMTMLFGYSIQIFTDFAGYSLIAIGVAKLYGYDLPKNFNFPYISKSFSEFWTRWHITLSTWLKEYLYIPLGGNRRGRVRTYINLFIVMLLGGLWHGAAWSYMFWGAYHGILLAGERFILQRYGIPNNRYLDIVRILMVFILVTLGWLLFKLPEFPQVILYCNAMIHNFNYPVNQTIITYVALYTFPVALYYVNYLLRTRTGKNYLDTSIVYAIMLLNIFINSGSSGEFIYFQF